MTALAMSLIAGELTDPLLDGSVAVAGPAAWSVTRGPSVDGNSRAMLGGAYDVAEMSFATFVKAREQGRDLIGLPIFTGRGFLQPGLIVSAASGVTRPEELRGKRIALPQFWMTSSVWHRGILAQQHGVAQDALTWLTAVEERFEGIVYPAGVAIERLPESVSPQDALAQGLADAIMVPPRGVPKNPAPHMRSPYPDLPAAQRAYVEATHVFPIMHFVVMRASLQAQHPWLPAAVLGAFTAAKRIAGERGTIPQPLPGLAAADERRLFGADSFAFGLAANDAALETFLGFARSQGWVGESLRLADCFVAG